jgi:hypothetical protein
MLKQSAKTRLYTTVTQNSGRKYWMFWDLMQTENKEATLLRKMFIY